MKIRMRDALPAISAQLPVQSIAFHFRLKKMNQAEDILSFSGLIFQDAFSAGFAKKPALHMPYSLSLILKWQNMTGRIWYTKRNICLSAVRENIRDITFISNAGVDMGVKGKGEGENEEMPVDIKELMP